MESKKHEIIISKKKKWNFSLYPLNSKKGGGLEIGWANLYRLKNGGAGHLFENGEVLKVYELDNKKLAISFFDREVKNCVVYEADKTSFYNDPTHKEQWQAKLDERHFLLIVDAIKEYEK